MRSKVGKRDRGGEEGRNGVRTEGKGEEMLLEGRESDSKGEHTRLSPFLSLFSCSLLPHDTLKGEIQQSRP